jgi:hypothetical protein
MYEENLPPAPIARTVQCAPAGAPKRPLCVSHDDALDEVPQVRQAQT